MTEKRIQGSIHCLLVGGPLDGARYGDVPDPGHSVERAKLTIPLSQPAETSSRAVYLCDRPRSPDEVWQFTYVSTVLPTLPVLPVGTQASFA